MSDGDEVRRERAGELRRRLREASDPDAEATPAEAEDGVSEMLPDESPNDFVQRRMRELDRERPSPG